jgi:hypothetical protein
VTAYAGQIALPGTYNDDIRKIVARGQRTSNSTGSTGTEVGVLRLDGVAVLASRIYTIYTSPLIINSTVANDVMEVFVRYSTTDSATTASTKVSSIAMSARSAGGVQYVIPFICDLPIAAAGSISVLLSINRTVGTGTVSITSSASYPIDLVVMDGGPDPGNTGIAL